MSIEEKNLATIHTSVMPDEILHWLDPKAGGRYIDGTLGLGGHSLRLLEKTDGNIEIAGLDRDTSALELAKKRLTNYQKQMHFFHMPFSDFEKALDALGWDEIDGAIVDLGVSSLQLDSGERGFSFQEDAPLDMRMDTVNTHTTAADLVADLNHGELARCIRVYGEDPLAGKIASAILREREKEPITHTLQLAEIIKQAYPIKMQKTARNHPATRTFQALRIAVNREDEELEYFLANIIKRLKVSARIVVISFHSLEDRIAKNIFREEAKTCICPSRQIICTCRGKANVRILTKKPQIPTDNEIADNKRSRSAKLRAAEKIL